MVLAAGLGTRLAPLTERLPKALVPIGDRPAIDHVLERLARSGARRVVVNTHHLPDAFTAAVLERLALPIDVVHERELLGTAGGVSNAGPLLSAEVAVVWNADVLADVDVAVLVDRLTAVRAEPRTADAVLAVAPRPAGRGTVGLDALGRVVRLRGETFGVEARGADFLGVQALGPVVRRSLPQRGCLVGDVYLPALRAGARIATVELDVSWDDIGSIAAYVAANVRWLEAYGRTAHVADTAHVDGDVTLERAIVGAGARVSGPGMLRDVVVWPGVEARAPLEHAVAFADGRVARCG